MDKMINFIIGNHEPSAWLSRTLRRWRAGAATALETEPEIRAPKTGPTILRVVVRIVTIWKQWTQHGGIA